MTSNPRFAQYVERVQQNLAVFSISDEAAKNFLRKSDSIANYRPSFLVFEILIYNQPESDVKPARMFDPHVSDMLIEGFNADSAMLDLERLHANAEILQEQGKQIDWQNVKWALPNDENSEFSNLGREVNELLRVHQELCGKHQHGRSIDQLEQALPEIDINANRSVFEKVSKTLKKLVKRYEREYIPTNLAASALIYEAWKVGNLQPLGDPEEDKRAFENLLNALFVFISKDSEEAPLPRMANDIGLPYLEKLGHSRLASGESWEKVPSEPWFTCVESSLVYQHLITEYESDTHVIHFPLVLDNYRFVGFCYLHTPVKNGQGLADIFIREKYPKFYCAIQAVSETLRFSLRADALDKVNKCLEEGQKNPELLFAEAVKVYLVCFDVVCNKKDGLTLEAERDSLNEKILYAARGIEVYGPKWVSEAHKEILFDELDGGRDQSNSDQIPSLYADVLLRIDRFEKGREQGRERGRDEQADLFSHQAAGLVSEVWCDKNMINLKQQSQGCLWHLKTLVDLWGNFDLEPKLPLQEGPQDYPQSWLDLSNRELLDKLMDTGIVHALRRSAYRRSGASHPKIDEKTIRKAVEIRKLPDRIDLFKKWVGLNPVNDLDVYPDWLSCRGFVLCFHHCFWQAAFHGFRARCGVEESSLEDVFLNCYVDVKIEANSVTISNKKLTNLATPEVPTASRDASFYEKTLLERIENTFKIEGPSPVGESSDIWKTVITPSCS
jgi:hypothetical protein